MRSRVAVLMLGCLLPLSQADSQAVHPRDSVILWIPLHQDSMHKPTREVLFVKRGLTGAGLGGVTAIPFAFAAAVSRSDDVLIAGSVAYVAMTSYGASLARSRDCSRSTRMLLAIGGSLAGAVGGAFAARTAYPTPYTNPDHVGRVTAVSLMVGAPIGAAAVLYGCR